MIPHNTHILLIEDVASILSWQKKILNQLGLNHIWEARNGKEALKILQQLEGQQTPIGLIFCDWQMPELDGLSFYKEIKKHPSFSQIPFIMVSAESTPEYVFQALEAGVGYFITKPFTTENFERKLESIWNDWESRKMTSASNE